MTLGYNIKLCYFTDLFGVILIIFKICNTLQANKQFLSCIAGNKLELILKCYAVAMLRLLEAKPKGSFLDCFQSFQNEVFALDFKTDSKMRMVDLPAIINDEVWLLLSNETVASEKCWWTQSCMSDGMLLHSHSVSNNCSNGLVVHLFYNCLCYSPTFITNL